MSSVYFTELRGLVGLCVVDSIEVVAIKILVQIVQVLS